MCFVYFEEKVWYKMSCCKKISCYCLMLTLFRWPLITENKHLLRDPQLSNLHHAVEYSKDRDLEIKRLYELYQSKEE